MPTDNSIGSVSVDIRGDLSKLDQDFAQAQALAQKSGASVATAFNAGSSSIAAAQNQVKTATANLASAQTQLASFIVAGNRAAITAVAGYQTQLTQAQATLAQLTATQAQATATQGAMTAAVIQTTAAVQGQSAAMAHGVSQIQATSGAIRVLEGNGAMRAVERFLTMIPGVGAALQVAFPLIGAIALVEMLGRVIGKVNELSEAEKHLAEATKQNDAEWERLAQQFERTDVSRMVALFGELAGLKLGAFFDKGAAEDARIQIQNTAKQLELLKKTLAETQSLYSNNIFKSALQDFNPLIVGERVGAYKSAGSEKDQIAKIKELQQAYDTLTEKLKVFDNERDASGEKRGKVSAEDAGQNSAARIANQERALATEAEMAKKVSDFQIAQSHAAVRIQIAGMHDADAASLASAQEELRVAQEKEKAITAALEAELPKRIALIRAQGAAEKQGKTPVEAARIDVATAGKIQGVEGEAAKQEFDAHAASVAEQNKVDEARAGLVRKQAADAATVWADAYNEIIKNAKEVQAIQEKAVNESLATFQKVSEIEAKSAGRTGAENIQGQKLQLERQYGVELGHTFQQQLSYLQQLAGFDEQARQKQIEGLQNELAIAQGIEDEGRQKIEVARIQAQINELEAKGANDAYAARTKILGLEKAHSLAGQLSGQAAQIPGKAGAALAQGVVDGKHIGQDIKQALTGIGQQMLGTVFSQLIKAIVTSTIVQTATHVVLGALHISLGANTGVLALNSAAVGTNTVASGVNTVASGVLTASNVALTAAIVSQTVATWASIAFLGFADGGRPPVGVASIVGERGPELFIPDTAGMIVPNGKFGGAGLQLPAVAGISSSTSSISGGNHTFNIYGGGNPREVARSVAGYLKTSSPQFSPLSR